MLANAHLAQAPDRLSVQATDTLHINSYCRCLDDASVRTALAVNRSASQPYLLTVSHPAGNDALVADLPSKYGLIDPDVSTVKELLGALHADLHGKSSPNDLTEETRWGGRTKTLLIEQVLNQLQARIVPILVAEKAAILNQSRAHLRGTIEYAPTWVLVAVAFALGLGTMVGWKRIVVTVGEKIGKTHLTYAQGASAELVAATTIGLGNVLGMPVSTTHVLSSGVAGTMAANKSGLQMSTIKSIALAWILTLPVSMILGGGLFLIFRQIV